MKEHIRFFSADKAIPLKNRNELKAGLHKLASNYGYSVFSLRYIFCSDDFLLEINKQSLQHDYYTDIITFDMRSDFSVKHIDAEIYISVDRVKENARSYGVSFKQELYRVMAHGILHLVGLNDKTKKEAEQMRLAEDKALEVLL